MADARNVTIRLRGDIADFQAKMVAAGRSVTAATDKITSAEAESRKWRDGLSKVGDVAGKMGLVAAAGVAGVVAAAANFDQAMSNIKAATHESASNMEALRAAAIKAGADTKFSASEAAGAIENLAKAGVATKDILGGGLDGALSLAAAGSMDVADAAETAARAMSQFGLKGTDVPHVADLLAAAAGKAVGEVSDFGMALNQTGLVANQVGLSIEETTGALAAFAQNGLQGSDAGTSFKTMLQRLTPTSEKAAKMMDALGISAYDAQGNFIGLAKFAGVLQKALQGKSAEERASIEQTIFGSDAIRAANVLYEEGARGIQNWTNKVNDQGYAAETAATKMDNLKGDLEQLKGSLETAFIGAGEGAQSPLRFLVQDATAAVNALNALPGPVKSVGVGLGALTAILGGGLWFTAKTINGISTMRTALTNLGETAPRAASGLRSVGSALGYVAGFVAAVELIHSAFHDSATAMQDFFDVVDARSAGNTTRSIALLNDELKKQQQIVGDSAVHFKAFGVGIFSSEDAARAQDKIDAITAKIAELKHQRQVDAIAAKAQGDATGFSTDALGPNTLAAYRNTNALNGQAKAIQKVIDARNKETENALSAFDAETAYGKALQEGADREKERADLETQLADARDRLASAKTASEKSAAQAEIDRLTESLKAYGKGLDATTEAGQANRQVLSDMASAWNNLDDKQKDAKGAYRDARQALIKQAEQFGATKKEAEKYADKLLKIPPNIQTKIYLKKQQAEQDLAKFAREFHGFDNDSVTAKVKIRFEELGLTGTGYGAYSPTRGATTKSGSTKYGWADGGYTGPGGKYEPAGIVHRGEFVINAEQTLRNRALLEAINRGVAGYASGGYVNRAVASQTTNYGGGTVTLAPGDIAAIASAVSKGRPLYGDVTMQPHNYSEFKRQMEQDQRTAAMGGANFVG